jgi:hypothetical protein
LESLAPGAGRLGVSPELKAALAPEALAALNARGRFDVSTAEDIKKPQLTEEAALVLATNWGHNYAIHIASALEEKRGGAIAFNRLQPCGRALYVASPYEVTPDSEEISIRNLLGPKWIVALCAGKEPQLSVSVAARAVELRVHETYIDFPPASGSEFFAVGVSSSWEGALAISAESAAIMVARRCGVRVLEAPRLVGVDPGWIPQAAQWMIRLETPVRIAGTSEEVSTVFVGLRLDGKAAVGVDAVIPQVPDSDASNTPGHASALLDRAVVRMPQALAWRTIFRPVTAGTVLRPRP